MVNRCLRFGDGAGRHRGRRTAAVGDLQPGKGVGKGYLVLLFLFHRCREHGHGFGVPFSSGVVNHPGIGAGVLPGFAGDDVAQVGGGVLNDAGDFQVAQAVLGFGAGDGFKDLRHFRVAFLSGFLGVGGIG